MASLILLLAHHSYLYRSCIIILFRKESAISWWDDSRCPTEVLSQSRVKWDGRWWCYDSTCECVRGIGREWTRRESEASSPSLYHGHHDTTHWEMIGRRLESRDHPSGIEWLEILCSILMISDSCVFCEGCWMTDERYELLKWFLIHIRDISWPCGLYSGIHLGYGPLIDSWDTL